MSWFDWSTSSAGTGTPVGDDGNQHPTAAAETAAFLLDSDDHAFDDHSCSSLPIGLTTVTPKVVGDTRGGSGYQAIDEQGRKVRGIMKGPPPITASPSSQFKGGTNTGTIQARNSASRAKAVTLIGEAVRIGEAGNEALPPLPAGGGGEEDDTSVDDLADRMFNMFRIQKENNERNKGFLYDNGTLFIQGLSSSADPIIDYEEKFASSAAGHSFKKWVDKVWANDLHRTAAQTTEAAEDKKDAIIETPEFLAAALREMDNQINSDNISPRDKQAHLRALEIHNQYCRRSQQYHHSTTTSECYVCTDYFRLRFLRAERYDPQKAAVRYSKSLAVIWKWFGDVALTRQLYMSDLSDAEIKLLLDGFVQVLPSRDRIGRRIFFLWNNRHPQLLC